EGTPSTRLRGGRGGVRPRGSRSLARIERQGTPFPSTLWVIGWGALWAAAGGGSRASLSLFPLPCSLFSALALGIPGDAAHRRHFADRDLDQRRAAVLPGVFDGLAELLGRFGPVTRHAEGLSVLDEVRVVQVGRDRAAAVAGLLDALDVAVGVVREDDRDQRDVV